MNIARLEPTRPSSAPLVTEDSAALDFVGRHADFIRYDHTTRAWFIFDGAHWTRDSTHRVRSWAREACRAMAIGPQPESARKVAGKFAFTVGVERFAQDDPRIAITADKWDCDPWLLGTPGGTVDLRTGFLREPDPADMMTMQTTVAPAAVTDCPQFKRFILEACGGDVELIAFLQRWLGYCLTGNVSEQALVFLIGDGGNGKGVLLNVIRRVLGDYARTSAMDTFIAAYGNKHPADLAALKGARLVVASETNHGQSWDESRIKLVTGGDPIAARYMRGDFFEYLPTFKLIFIGNATPDLRAVDTAMRRRFNIVRFDNTPACPDLRLEEKLMAEASAILRWLIDGCLAWQTGGLNRPVAVLNASRDYFRDQDVFARWLDECCILSRGDETARTGATALWDSWFKFSTAARKAPGSSPDFKKNLEMAGAIWTKGRTGNSYTGISLAVDST